jgi:DNA-binding MarR family transcriptional regulator
MSASPHHPSDQHNATDSLVADILASLAKVTERFESNENEEWQWIIQHSSDPVIVEMLQELSVTALRVIDAIGRLEPVNGIRVSEQFRIPKGTVSKVTRRLIANNLVRAESRPNNKKEVLFRLTPLGNELFHVHRAFDEQMERGFKRFLQRYNADELRLLVRVLHDATEASFITLGQQALESQEQVK